MSAERSGDATGISSPAEFSFAIGKDLPHIEALLKSCGLMIDGIRDLLIHSVCARVGSRLVGVIALEPYGEFGLLRSLAVEPRFRRQALGRSLCNKVSDHARDLGVRQLYLLTVDAAGFFKNLGFRVVERSSVPSVIASTSQFKSLCPKSAVCMARPASLALRS